MCRSRSIGYAHWFSHVNGVNPAPEMRAWLIDTMSLTRKLTLRSRTFRIQRLRQEREVCLADECTAVALPQGICIQAREVLLHCDGRPVVFAHTIMPLTATASDWPFFGSLGERSLGTTLFGDPKVRRYALEFARLRVHHPLVQRACQTVGMDALEEPLYARRCLYRRNKGVLLVTEVFLPMIRTIREREIIPATVKY
jgi:chorismate lyase